MLCCVRMRGNFLTIRSLFVIAATAFALLLAAGCGGSDESTTASSAGESSGSPSENPSGESSGGSSGGSSSDSGDSSGGVSGGSSEGLPGSTPGDSSSGSSGKSPGGKSSGGGGAAGEAGSPSGGSFIAQVKAVCVETKRQFEGETGAFIERTTKNPPKPTETPPEITVIETIFVPNYQAGIDELGSLDVPSGDAEWFEAFLGALQQVIDDISDDPQSFIESEGSFGEAAKLAYAHDIDGCAEV